MNIFLFDYDLDNNAKFFFENDRKRFNKQIVESTQLLAASLKHWENRQILKADGNPYVVNRILFHPACKWLLVDKVNHEWHIRYLRSLFKLAPNHACVKSVEDAISGLQISNESPNQYLCIANSDMNTFPEIDNTTVTGRYMIHIKNKWKKEL